MILERRKFMKLKIVAVNLQRQARANIRVTQCRNIFIAKRKAAIKIQVMIKTVFGRKHKEYFCEDI